MASTSNAQVLRCTDPVSGQVTYTDSDCAHGARATEIERRKTDDELAQDKARTEKALHDKAVQREQALESRRIAAQEQAARAVANPPQPAVQTTDYANSSACQQSRERYNTALDAVARKLIGSHVQLDATKRQMELDCMGPEAYGRLEASRPAPTIVVPVDNYWNRYPNGRPRPPQRPQPAQQPVPDIVHCDVFKCVDAQGYSHPRGAIGETPRRPAAPTPARPLGNCRSQGGQSPC